MKILQIDENLKQENRIKWTTINWRWSERLKFCTTMKMMRDMCDWSIPKSKANQNGFNYLGYLCASSIASNQFDVAIQFMVHVFWFYNWPLKWSFREIQANLNDMLIWIDWATVYVCMCMVRLSHVIFLLPK